jgi:hypothetical protein
MLILIFFHSICQADVPAIAAKSTNKIVFFILYGYSCSNIGFLSFAIVSLYHCISI